MAPFDAACKTEPQLGMFDPVVEWHKDMFMTSPGANASASAPLVVQVNDDNMDGKVDSEDMPDILNIMYNPNNQAVLRAISGDGSSEVLSIVIPGGTREEGLAAADIDNDGFIEILSSSNNGQQILCYEHDGTLKWTSPMLTAANAGTYETYPAILDMNGDGKPEIVAGRVILNSAGSQVGVGMFGIGAPPATPTAAPPSPSPPTSTATANEVVVGNALYRMDGTAIWSNASNDGYPGVADFDLDGIPEIVVVSNAEVHVHDSSDGALIWKTATPAASAARRPSPTTTATASGGRRRRPEQIQRIRHRRDRAVEPHHPGRLLRHHWQLRL
ncbi:VCBS repeat-containing protein [Nannocystis sp.]|uniref:FG-GAP repeat domain-containing protein n=1 Tax=Nannocystis sp. TaxID=1962667 RepID=UPI0025FD6179|nr:VCBS repeat-containing protein [Nannocystis sp.]MBK7829434.1 VCBS repeat-containing protein [Nannocystis sp.]